MVRVMVALLMTSHAAQALVAASRTPTTAALALRRLSSVASSSAARRAAATATATATDPKKNKKRVLVPIADGSEEIETTCISDTLVRAGAAVTVASANADGSTAVTMSRGIRILADAHVDDLGEEEVWDLVAIPGGMPGASNLAASSKLAAIVEAQARALKPLAAVCASPAVVLKPLGVLDGKQATCYPGPAFLDAIGDAKADGDVVVDGNVVTSRGPGTSLQFALALVEKLFGPEKKTELATQMLVPNVA